MEDIILITLRENDLIRVDKKTLTENGTVFEHLINELGQKQLEMDDFDPGTVRLFVESLQEKRVEHIEEENFRDLHKLSVVFGVSWLVEYSRKWLKSRIVEINESTTNQRKMFLYKECFFICDKWKIFLFVDTLILKLRFMDNTLMISEMLSHSGCLKTSHLKYLLHLAGSDTGTFLQIMIFQINIQQSVNENTRFILQNLNLPLCIQRDEELYHELFHRLSQSSKTSNGDLKMALALTNEATKQVLSNRNSPTSDDLTVYDSRKWFDIEKRCDNLMMIYVCVVEGLVTSMYDVIEMSARVVMQAEPSTEEVDEFFEQLEHSGESLQKVSNSYVTMIISALKFTNFSSRREKLQLVRLLEMFNGSDKLSAKFSQVQLIGELTKGSSLATSLKSMMKIKTQEKYIFKYKHPGIKDCEREGHCGFMLKFNKENATYELSQNPSDYQNRSIHTHDIFKAGKMSWYSLEHGESRLGSKTTLPKRWRWGWFEWGYKWFRREDGLYNVLWQSDREQFCVDYDISDHLAAKLATT